MHLGHSGSVLSAYPVLMDGKDHYFVFWQTAGAYGARGDRLTLKQAEDLAARLLSGEETP